jgi:hypothetical protein
MRISLTKIVYLFSALFLLSCGGTEKTEEIISEEEIDTSFSEESKFNAQNVFNSLPDRTIILKLIEESKLEYNPDLLNNPTSVNNYALEAVKAVNLGIYGSDLSIASSFNQTQESMLFLKCVNVLATQLGVSAAFDQQIFERIDANESNKDSVIEIVTGAFRRVDEILKMNNRPATAAVILSGCWIEGLYVSCQLAQNTEAQAIVRTIIAQKESLKNLIVMLENVTLEEKSKFILTDLQGLYKSFEIAETQTEFNKKTIASITKQISDLRNKITSVV